jgi:tripartite-type tricarboxylate transporter receptor subunit TctC
MLKRKQRNWLVILTVSFILVSAGWADRVQAEDKYPARAIEVIQPFAPGGSTDLTVRQVSEYVKKKWGMPVNVVSKAGGRGIPAILEVYQAKPDGYTILADSQASSSMLAAATAATKDLPFDVMNRTYVATFNAIAYVIFVPSTSPFKTLKDFVEGTKTGVKDISYTAGPTALEYALRQLFEAAGADISKAKSVMVKGASEAVLLAAGGHVTIGAAALGTTLPAIKAGTIRPLFITSKNRWPELPDLPTSAELGYPEVDSVYWSGISGPPKMPSHVSDIWNKAIQEMLANPAFVAQFKNAGAMPFYNNGPATAELVKRETAKAIKMFK